jgi:hypothetical protein
MFLCNSQWILMIPRHMHGDLIHTHQNYTINTVSERSLHTILLSGSGSPNVLPSKSSLPGWYCLIDWTQETCWEEDTIKSTPHTSVCCVIKSWKKQLNTCSLIVSLVLPAGIRWTSTANRLVHGCRLYKRGGHNGKTDVYGNLHCWILVHMEIKEWHDLKKYSPNIRLLEKKIQRNFPLLIHRSKEELHFLKTN